MTSIRFSSRNFQNDLLFPRLKCFEHVQGVSHIHYLSRGPSIPPVPCGKSEVLDGDGRFEHH